MNRFQGFVTAFVFLAASLWAQGQAAGPQHPAAAAQPAAGQATTVSGCMSESFGRFQVSDAGKSWEVKGAGSPLWGHENKVVKVQGLPDDKSSSPVLYAQSVQDTGAACGNGQAAVPNTAATATPAAPAPASAQATPLSPGQQPGGGVTQAPSAPAQPAQPNAVGAPSAQSSTPENSTAAAAPAAPAAPADQNLIFSGCLKGSVNNYQFNANGKNYRLQGNTSMLPSMIGHRVEVTGEDFNGKAIQVNGARDLSPSCK